MGFLKRDKRGSRSRRELEALFELSRALVGAAGIGEVAHALFRAIDDVLNVDRCVLFTVDDELTRASAVAVMGDHDDAVQQLQIDLEVDESAISRVVRDRAPHRVVDGNRESLHSRQIAAVLDIRSAIYVPLATSAGVIAVAVIGTTDVRAFRREEVDLAQKLASDAAVSIERARFARALQDVGERELVVAHIARTLRETLDQRELLRLAAREIGEQTDAQRVSIAVLGGEGLDRVCAEWTDEAPEEVAISGFKESELSPSARFALAEKSTVTSRAPNSDEQRTALALVLQHRDARPGVVVVERPHLSFDQTEERLMELIGVEVAAALEYVRLYQGGQRHLSQQLALARAAQSLTADLRFDRVIEHIVDEVVKVLITTSAAFYVYDREQRTLTLSAAHGEQERQAVGETMGLVGLAGRVVKTGVSQFTNSYTDDFQDEVHPVFLGVDRAIAVPVRWQGDLRGVISVASREFGAPFDEREVKLLEAFADLASLALHNADAYSAHGRQARIQAGFYRISQVLAASLSRSHTLEALASAASDALDGDFALVIGGDGAEEALHLESSYGAPEALVEQLNEAEPDLFAEGPGALARSHRQIVTSRTIADDDRLGAKWKSVLSAAGVEGLLAVPIIAHGNSSAVVLVCYMRPIRFGDEELVVGRNLATAAAAALERAGLFENERRMRRLSDVLADVSSLLAETLKSQSVLDRIVEHAAVLIGVDACSLAVPPPAARGEGQDQSRDAPELMIHSASGQDESLVSSLLAVGEVGGLVEEAARSKRSLSIEEHASETSGQNLRGTSYESFLAVPLLHPRGYLIGVLSAYSRRHHTWTEAEVSALESFASSAAIAIRNAELYTNVKRERDRIETLLSSIAEGIVATDAAGRVTIWNRAAEQLTGVPASDVLGRAWRDVLGLSSDADVVEGQSVIEARPGGVPMWLSVTASRLREKTRELGWIYAFRDVSANYTLDRLKSDFVSTVSYVLRAPLTSIYGFAQTLLREDMQFDEDDRKVFLGYIAEESERLAQIVDELLQVAEIDAGSVEVHVQDTDVGAVVEEVGVRFDREDRKREVRVDVPDGTAMNARADASKLKVVVENLVENALRFSPIGGVVSVVAERDNGSVHIKITDSGGGIPLAEQKHLFTKFYVSPHAEAQGTGLGLYISKGLVDAMGGSLSVTSQQGSGSTFIVELPGVTPVKSNSDTPQEEVS